MEKVIKIYDSFEEADLDDIEYYKNLDPNKKIEELNIIREKYLNSINAGQEERRIKKILEIVDRDSLE